MRLPVIEPTAEPDAYGRTGEWESCWPCCGSGIDYEETCVTCGGFGWVRWPATDFTVCPKCMCHTDDADGVLQCPNCGWSEEDEA